MAASTSRSPYRRRPPPCGRDGAGGTTLWNNSHSSSGTRRSTIPTTADYRTHQMRRLLIRLPDRARGRTVRAGGRVAVCGRSGEGAGGPDTGGRAPARARRHVRRAEPRERGRAPAAPGARRSAHAAVRRRTPGPRGRHQPLAPPGRPDQRRPPVLPRLRTQRSVLRPVHPRLAILLRRRLGDGPDLLVSASWTPSTSGPRTISPRSPPPRSAAWSKTSSTWAAGALATATSSSSSMPDTTPPA